MFEEDVQKIAQVFKDKGIGIILVYAYPESKGSSNMAIKCYSTVRPTKEIITILNLIYTNLGLLPLIKGQIISSLVVESPDEGLCEAAEWASSVLRHKPPMIVAAVGEEVFSAYAVGTLPMLAYLAVRIDATMRRTKGGHDVLEDFPLNLN